MQVVKRPWVQGEDAILADTTLTAAEMALKLGRSAHAVAVRRSRLRAKGLLPPVVRLRKHGASKYSNHGCRCDECRAGIRDYLATYRSKRAARLAADPSLAKHGQEDTYSNWSCRCTECRAAHTSVVRERRCAKQEV